MKTTRLVLLLSAFAFTACDNLSLEGDAARPYACIPHAPADAGKQCADGWSCGFDEKCFKLDSGQAESWRCRFDDECPGGWRCGAEVAGQQLCQQLDVGAPSPCNALADCQGGWRCGFEHACFDPAIADGGSQRQCTDDAQAQCPLGFRCGERVGSGALCLLLDAGTSAPCNSDRGCEGGFRCDTRAHLCVELHDVVTPGSLANLRSTLLSPLSNAPPPLLFAATGATSSNVFQRVGEPGVVFVSLDDAGVLSTIGQALSGEIAKETFQLARPATSVKRVGVTTTGPFVVYGDGSRERFTFHLPGPGVAEGMTDFNAFTFESASMSPFPETRMLVVKGATVLLNGTPYSLPDTVLAATVWNDTLFAWTNSGQLHQLNVDGGFVASYPMVPPPTPAIAPGASVSVVAGVAGSNLMPPQTRPGFFLVAPGGYQPWLPYMGGWVSSSQLIAPCDPMLQLSFSEDGNNPAAIVRCGRPDGGAFSIKQTFEGGAMTSGLIAKSSNVVDDLVPYRGAVVNQTAASTVRAHAAARGRVWHALPESMAAVVGERPLRALVLDRQPDVILWVRAANTSALFASANGTVFSTVARNNVSLDLGFVSDLSPQNIVPLQTFANRGRWLVASGGIIDVVGSATPSVVAQLPSGTLPLSAPVSAFVTTLGQREVVLLSSRDTIWAADVTGVLGDPFAQPGVLEPVLVPAPGVRLRSLTLVPQDAGVVGGFVTTSTQTLRFETADLVRWSLSAVESPDAGLPLEVWAQGAQGRVGAADGIIWSLPIMVALTASLRDGSGNALAAGDYARLCGEQLVTTSQGVQRLVPAPDAGLPVWAPLTAVNAALDSLDGLKFYETTSEPADGGALAHQLYVATPSGQVVEVLGDGPCP